MNRRTFFGAMAALFAAKPAVQVDLDEAKFIAEVRESYARMAPIWRRHEERMQRNINASLQQLADDFNKLHELSKAQYLKIARENSLEDLFKS